MTRARARMIALLGLAATTLALPGRTHADIIIEVTTTADVAGWGGDLYEYRGSEH